MSLSIGRLLILTVAITMGSMGYSQVGFEGNANLYQCEAVLVGKDFNTPPFYSKIPSGALLATPFVAIYSNNSKGGAIIYTYASRGWGESRVDCSLIESDFCVSKNYFDERTLRSSVSLNAFDTKSGEPSEASVISIETRSDWGFYISGQFLPGRNQGRYYKSNCRLIQTGLTQKEIDQVISDSINILAGDWKVTNPPAMIEDTIPRLY
jgi:hypothetical protein